MLNSLAGQGDGTVDGLPAAVRALHRTGQARLLRQHPSRPPAAATKPFLFRCRRRPVDRRTPRSGASAVRRSDPACFAAGELAPCHTACSTARTSPTLSASMQRAGHIGKIVVKAADRDHGPEHGWSAQFPVAPDALHVVIGGTSGFGLSTAAAGWPRGLRAQLVLASRSASAVRSRSPPGRRSARAEASRFRSNVSMSPTAPAPSVLLQRSAGTEGRSRASSTPRWSSTIA